MNNNYNPSTQENEIERMKQLMGYGLNENKSHDNGNSNVAYHQVGPDGNTYGIIKECNKFYIKVAPKKDTEILAEDYDYIGGYMNKKQYEYPTYTIASKQFGLKMKSLNEAFATKESKNKVVFDKPIEPAEWQVNETKEMRQEINRFNQLMNNVDYILSEGKELEGKALQLGNKDVDEEGGNAYQENPVSEKEVNNMKENAPAPKDSDGTYNEKPMSVDQVNKMKENSKDPKKADNTYSKSAPKTLKLTNEQAEKVLAWSQDKNYMDTTHGTEIGDSAPYDEKPEVTNEAVYNSDDMNQHTGNAEEYMEPFDDKVNEEVEIDSETGLPTEDGGQMLVDDEEMLPDQALDYETRDDMDDFEPIDNSGEDMLPDEVLDYETRDDMDYVLESVVKKVLKKHLVKENKLDVFGKHPAYQKQPMTLPSNFEPSKFGKEWDDDSVKSDKPYGTEIGHGGDPYTERVIDMLTDSVVDKLVASMTGEAGKKKNLSERKVLSVPSPEPQLPPMDNDMEMNTPVGGGSFDQEMGQMPQQEEPQEEFGADFDAGVEANEDEDPKKYIQQLTGKLSQSLRKYNEGLPKPDAELSKYVAGMIIKQAVDGLSQEDVADIMDKVENDGNEEDMEQTEQQPTPMGNEQPEMQPEMSQPSETEQMNETTGSTIDATENKTQKKTTKMRKGGYSRKPYIGTI